MGASTASLTKQGSLSRRGCERRLLQGSCKVSGCEHFSARSPVVSTPTFSDMPIARRNRIASSSEANELVVYNRKGNPGNDAVVGNTAAHCVERGVVDGFCGYRGGVSRQRRR